MSSAFADTPSADLHVGGIIKAGSCTPTLSSSTFDYGAIKASTLSKTEPTALEKKDFTFSITCKNPMKIGFNIFDDRSDSATTLTGLSYYPLGLGKTTEGVNIGGYDIISTTGQAEQITDVAGGGKIILDAIQSGVNGTKWGNAPAGYAYPPSLENYIFSLGNATSGPATVQQANFYLTISPVLQPRNTLKMTDDTHLDGQATFTVVYL